MDNILNYACWGFEIAYYTAGAFLVLCAVVSTAASFRFSRYTGTAVGELKDIRVYKKIEPSEKCERKRIFKGVYRASAGAKVKAGENCYAGAYAYSVNGNEYEYNWNQMFFKKLPPNKQAVLYDPKEPSHCCVTDELAWLNRFRTALYAIMVVCAFCVAF